MVPTAETEKVITRVPGLEHLSFDGSQKPARWSGGVGVHKCGGERVVLLTEQDPSPLGSQLLDCDHLCAAGRADGHEHPLSSWSQVNVVS